MDEHESIQFDDIATILQQAHLRRSADLGLWLKQYFRQSHRVKARMATAQPPDRIVSITPISDQAG